MPSTIATCERAFFVIGVTTADAPRESSAEVGTDQPPRVKETRCLRYGAAALRVRMPSSLIATALACFRHVYTAAPYGRIVIGVPSWPAKTIKNLAGVLPRFRPLCHV